jgi:protein-S-isoprenylcysteine O-methyltransferase Ste14
MLISLPFSQGPLCTAIFWFACALWIIPELTAAKLKRSTSSAKARDRGSLTLIAILWLTGILLAFLFSSVLPGARLRLNEVVVFCGGIVLMLAGVAFRWYSARVLGKYFTFDVATHNEQALVKEGPYRYIRHPSYSGALISLAGFGLALGNWASLAAAVSCLGLAYCYRIPVEEAALIVALGETYVQYKKRTWRLLPFVF